MNSEEENNIIERCKKYEPAAQQDLYNKHRKKMFAVCLQYGNYEDAKDMLQEGFIKIFTDIKNYKGTGSFEGWARRVIINTALMTLRKKRKLQFDPLENHDVSEKSEEPDELDSLLNELTENDILRLLEKLPGDLRIIFNLYCIEDHSHKEIGDLLGITESNSRIKLMRARKLLQKYIKDLILT